MAEPVEHGLIVSFPDQSPTFTLGFEAGMIWQRIESGERAFDVVCRIENKAVINRMAAARKGGVIFEEGTDHPEGWCTAHVEMGRPNGRPALKLVERDNG